MTTLMISALRPLAAIAAALLIWIPQTRELGPRPTGTGALGGRVVREASPVARALVTLNAGDGRANRQMVTDDEGRFVFAGLPAGRYLLTASKQGWVTTYFGSARIGRPPGVRVAVEDGARVTVDIPIVPGSVIGGRIVDDNGRPIARQFPWLLESRMVGDRRQLARLNLPYDVGNFERMTDDRGEFRFFGLPPGTYYLVVTPSRSVPGARLTTADEVRWAIQPPGDSRAAIPAPGPIAGYAPIYFPGTYEASQAQPITLGPGEVRDDLTYRAGFVPIARVSGVAVQSNGAPAGCASISLLELDPKANLEGAGLRAAANREGQFAVQEVPPGDYRVVARSIPCVIGDSLERPSDPQPRLSATPILWGQTTVSVSGRDVDGLSITLGPASTINGRLVFEGGTLAPPADFTRIRLQFYAATDAGSVLSGSVRPGVLQTARVEADGTFRVEGLAPDRYIAAASWPGMRSGDGTSGWWLSAIRVGTTEAGDAIGVAANTDVRGVSLIFRDRVGTIEGRLTDAAGRPAPEYFVFAFPVDRASWTAASRRRLPPARPGTDGHFKVTGVLAGEYYLAVVTGVDPGDVSDASFLETLVGGAIKVVVADGETKRQDLKIQGR